MADPDPMDLLAAGWGETPPEPGALAVLRARPTRAFPRDALVCEQGFRPLHDALAAEGREAHARLPDRSFPAAAVALTRSRAENRANLARAWAMVPPGGRVLAAGAKTDGIESLQKDLKKLGLLGGALPRSHGRVIWAERAETTPDLFPRWIAEAAPAERVEADGRRFRTVAGAFSWDSVDPGSRLLAEALPPLKGAVADLGAGWGWLAHAVLRSEAVTRVDLIEAEAAALDCARANLLDERANFHWADVLRPGLPAGGHDAVVANPPFHDGREVALELGLGFLRTAARLLKPSGTLWVVANRTLPYERTLAELFVDSEEAGGDRVYKLLRATKPRRGAPRSG